MSIDSQALRLLHNVMLIFQTLFIVFLVNHWIILLLPENHLLVEPVTFSRIMPPVMRLHVDIASFQGVKSKSSGNAVLWHSHSPHHKPAEHLWDILERLVRQLCPPPPSKQQIRKHLLEECCSFPHRVPETWRISGSAYFVS